MQPNKFGFKCVSSVGAFVTKLYTNKGSSVYTYTINSCGAKGTRGKSSKVGVFLTQEMKYFAVDYF